MQKRLSPSEIIVESRRGAIFLLALYIIINTRTILIFSTCLTYILSVLYNTLSRSPQRKMTTLA